MSNFITTIVCDFSTHYFPVIVLDTQINFFFFCTDIQGQKENIYLPIYVVLSTDTTFLLVYVKYNRLVKSFPNHVNSSVTDVLCVWFNVLMKLTRKIEAKIYIAFAFFMYDMK